ncbi:Tyrosine recombinase XerA [Candidatus Burarchaeum australiense]|nr:Tyrosine recombinase XerA [Candidatus Burarchaeum australiense]
MAEFDIHHQKRTLEARLRWLEETKEIGPEDKQLMLGFYKDGVARGLSISRSIKYLLLLSQLSTMLKTGLKNAKKQQIMDLVVRIEQSDYSNWSKKDYKVALKCFYKWLNGGEDYPESVKWIKATVSAGKHKLPEELLTEEEVKALSDQAEHPRDKAFVQVLYETGCRIGELLTLHIKNISFDDYGAILRVTGKTGDRRVRIVASAPTLAAWLDIHPKRNDPECPLWLSRTSKTKLLPFNYSTGNVLLRRLAKKAGIKKRVNPHLFRHSRATHLANKLTEAQMKEYFGWTQSSEMASVYVHLSGRDVDSAILQLHGLKNEAEKKEDKFRAKSCHRCKQPNSPTSQFCNKCGAVLNLETALLVEHERAKADNMLNELVKDKETLDYLAKKIIELNLAEKPS